MREEKREGIQRAGEREEGGGERREKRGHREVQRRGRDRKERGKMTYRACREAEKKGGGKRYENRIQIGRVRGEKG